jgi:glycosyltransferase involved in cell wall biosynthesis
MIDVVVPIHNEGACISTTLREFYEKVTVESKIPIRFVVCEDGSNDDTLPVLKALTRELPLKLISDPVRKGYSRAVIDGLRATDSEWVVCIDSDGQCDPGDFARLTALRNDADLVMGWRNPRSDPRFRRWMSGAFGVIYRIFFDVRLRDPSCPYILIRRASLECILAGNVGILQQGFWWEFVARATALGLTIKETPVHHRHEWYDAGLSPGQDSAHRHRTSDRPLETSQRTKFTAGLTSIAWRFHVQGHCKAVSHGLTSSKVLRDQTRTSPMCLESASA